MNKTDQAKRANERKADLLEAKLIVAFKYAPDGVFFSQGEAARFLATATVLAPIGSIRKYLEVYKARGEKGPEFARLRAARAGPAKRRHETMYPSRPAVWCNREGLPPVPVEPAPVEAVEPEPVEAAPVEPEPVEAAPVEAVEPEAAPEPMYWPDGDIPSGQIDRAGLFRREPEPPYDPFAW